MEQAQVLKVEIVITAEDVQRFQSHPEQLDAWMEEAMANAKENLKLMMALRPHE